MAQASKSDRGKPSTERKPPPFTQWSKAFLAELAETSNITASAKRAGVTTSHAYDARRRLPDFNRAWQQALCEGYDHLEMELLYRLRTGEIKRAAAAKVGVRTFDNASAMRQLAAHRVSAARQRAIRTNEDAEAIVQSINTKLEAMRQRRLAASEQVIDGG